MATAIGSTVRNGIGGTLYSDGSFVPAYSKPMSSSTNQSAANYGGRLESGSVLGTSTGSGGGSTGQTLGTAAPQPSGPSPEELAKIEAENQLRNDISSGYDSYFSSLDAQLGRLPGQQQSQEQIVGNLYNQGVSDLTAQKESGMADLGTQRRKTQESQVTNLQDLSENIRNLFRTGAITLGSRGAGDSSAVNQYSYAIGKLGAKERANVLSQTRSIENDIGDRESKLNNIFTQETSKLKTNRDNQIIQIAQWFQEKQGELETAKAQGQLQKGQSLAQLSMSLLQEAQQRLMQVDADMRNRQNMLTEWATNQSNSIGELKKNLQQVGSYQAPGVQRNQLGVGMGGYDAGGRFAAPAGYGSSSSDDLYKGLYGY